MRGRPTRCRGFLLPVLLIALAAVGVLSLSVRPERPADYLASRQSVAAARMALIAYINAYPESYGPRGAGPGHLPCPDTDGFGVERDFSGHIRVSAAGRELGDDGPNPPCGTGDVAIGWLPRHVGFPERRIAFHVEPAQRLIYAVDTSVVNNPARSLAVDDADIQTDGRVHNGRRTVAVIVDPGASVIDGDELTAIRSMIASTAAPALSRALRQSPGGLLITSANTRPRIMASLTREDVDRVARLRVLAWLAAREPTCNPETIQTARVISDEALLSCLLVGEDNLDGVPVASHWFTRDGWQHRVAFRVDPAPAGEETSQLTPHLLTGEERRARAAERNETASP